MQKPMAATRWAFETDAGKVPERGLEVGFDLVGLQLHDVRHHLLHVLVAELGVATAVEQVGRRCDITHGRESPTDVTDMLIDPEGLLQHHHCASGSWSGWRRRGPLWSVPTCKVTSMSHCLGFLPLVRRNQGIGRVRQ